MGSQGSHRSTQGDGAQEVDPIDLRPGTIPYCPHQGCGFRCCEFQQGNYIVLYPGELEAAKAAGKSTAHLQDFEPYNGGYKTICRARDTATCDNGYKPLDCKSYPFFPTVDAKTGRIRAGLKGAKCPLAVDMIPFHRTWVEQAWQRVADNKAEIRDWLSKVVLVGYEDV